MKSEVLKGPRLTPLKSEGASSYAYMTSHAWRLPVLHCQTASFR